jgi:hypothetical protein
MSYKTRSNYNIPICLKFDCLNRNKGCNDCIKFDKFCIDEKTKLENTSIGFSIGKGFKGDNRGLLYFRIRF